jgi:hypothetical protein
VPDIIRCHENLRGFLRQQNLRKAYVPAKTPFAPNQQYSITFTEAVVGYLSKQLGELPVTQQKMDTGKAFANNETLRKQLWVEKWDYR